MAKPLATGKELSRLRKEGMEVTPENLRKVKEMIRKEDTEKSEARNRKGMKAGPAVAEPAGMYNKGGMVKKKGSGYANCGASVPASKKR